jgi:hypothetical protein
MSCHFFLFFYFTPWYISLIYDVFLNKYLQDIFDGINSPSAKISWTRAAKGAFRWWLRDQWIQAILLVESFKFDPKAFWWGSKNKKWQIEAKPKWHLFLRENQQKC